MLDEKHSVSEKNPPVNVTGIFLEHTTFLKKFLAKFLQSEQDIEDVAQEAYLKAYGAEQDKGCIEHPKAFLFSIAKNLALNELSRKSRQMTDYLEESQARFAQDDLSSTEHQVEATESIGIYCEAVAELPERCRRIYLLRKVHGLTHREISDRLGVSISTVEKQLRLGALSCLDYIKRREQSYSTKIAPNQIEVKDRSNG